MPKMAAILVISFFLLAVSCGTHAAANTSEACQPALSGFSGTLEDISMDNGSCTCRGPCFQESPTGGCELVTGTLQASCFILVETSSGNFTCSVPMRSVFDTASSIIFAVSAVSAAAPFVITVVVILPYLHQHKQHHGHGKAARTTVTVIAASFAVGWLISVGLLIIGLIVEISIGSLNCVRAADG